jgi:hypothetical protein
MPRAQAWLTLPTGHHAQRESFWPLFLPTAGQGSDRALLLYRFIIRPRA